jgi:hypothetical protein
MARASVSETITVVVVLLLCINTVAIMPTINALKQYNVLETDGIAAFNSSTTFEIFLPQGVGVRIKEFPCSTTCQDFGRISEKRQTEN